MSLSCFCDDYYDYYYESPRMGQIDFELFTGKRRKRCASCNTLINHNENIIRLCCYRSARCVYEEERFGDEVPMADKLLCRECGEIFLNLTEIGYCLTLGHDFHDDLKEYWELTGFDPSQYSKNSIK